MASAPVHLALIFHCNQAVSHHTQVAAENCYRGLFRVLERHPRARLNFHLSGTLLTCLQWWYPELVEAIGRRVARGQWELLASTFAQSVHHTGPPALNRLALGTHRALLASAFPGVSPRGHWISERSWRPEMAEQIAAAGLDYTLIEDHMLADAGCTDLLRPRRIPAGGGRDLTVFTDVEGFKHVFNWAVWTGEFEPALAHLRRVRDEARGQFPPIVTYAEDAEINGLWGAERGCPPQIAWEHLDGLLTAIEREPGIRLSCLSDYLERHGDSLPVEPCRIGPGQAKWMCASLADPDLPYHEDGYTDWFDFNRRAEKLQRFRPLFRRACRAVESARPRTAPQRRLLLQAALALTSHTFEFGCIGIGSKRSSLWERHRVARLPLALLNGDTPRANGPADLNADGRREHVLVSRDLLSLWSRRTGALLYLFDRPTGDEMVGNELAAGSIYGRGHDDEIIPEPRLAELTWSGFRSARQRLEDFDGLWETVSPEQSWMRHLIDWSALDGSGREVRQVKVDPRDPWVLENGSREKAGILWPPRVRQRALAERLIVDGTVALDVAALSRESGARVRLRANERGFVIRFVTPSVTLEKTVSQVGAEIRVDHTLINRTDEERRIELQIDSEWVPSHLTTLLHGRPSVEITDGGARNTLTGATVEFTMSRGAELSDVTVSRSVEETLLGIFDRRTIILTLAPRGERQISSRLRVRRGTEFEHIDDIAKEWPQWCGHQQ